MRPAALLLAVATGACAATPSPSRDELAAALGNRAPATPSDITHIACEQSRTDPVGVTCQWRQRDGRRWQGWQTQLAHSADGWRLTDRPVRRP